MKKVISLLSILGVLISSFSLMPDTINAEAFTNTAIYSDIALMDLYTKSATSELSINDGTAYCVSTLNGISSVTKIEATQYLEKKTLFWWSNVKSWSKTSNSSMISMSNTEHNVGSGTYRLRTVFKVYSGSNSEEIEKISS